MKTRNVISIIILALAVLNIVGSCATEKKMVKDSEEIFGIWVNEKYASRKNYTTLVMKPDGVFEEYVDESLKTLSARGKYTITDKWTDSEGNIWYKATYELKDGTQLVTGFLLVKISDSGNIYEENYDKREYPTEINSINPTYSIYYRQE
jgi:hypothetical protein